MSSRTLIDSEDRVEHRSSGPPGSMIRPVPDREAAGVHRDTMESPVGRLVLATTESGVVAIAFGGPPSPEVSSARSGVGPMGEPPRMVEVKRQLGEYFGGRRREFDVEIDWSRVRGFRRRVLQELAEVPFGEVTTYGELAARSGSPGAARAVGSAMAANPLPILVPCHRVLRSGMKLGGYSGGLDVKRWLLAHEGIAGVG